MDKVEPVAGSFLAGIETLDRHELLAAGMPRRYLVGDTLFHQGDPSRYVVVLLEGWVKVSSVTRTGWEALLAIRGAGDIIGELSAIDGRPRSATVRALTTVGATVIPTDQFHKSLATNSSIADALMRHMVGNLRESDGKRTEYGASSGHDRLIGLLIELVDRHGRATESGTLIDLPLTQTEMAAAVGVSREVVAKTLRLLRERRIVVTQRQRVIVERLDLLRSIARSV